jgi:hypothetical protein
VKTLHRHRHVARVIEKPAMWLRHMSGIDLPDGPEVICRAEQGHEAFGPGDRSVRRSHDG